jgi:hypothetical protein
MKLMTTQDQGQRPGRARLGVCGHLPVQSNPNHGGSNPAASWRNPAAAALCPKNATTGAYVAMTTFEQGLGSIKRPAQHLGVRLT